MPNFFDVTSYRMVVIFFIFIFSRHSKELIQRLEQAGLGYHVDADKTTDKLGNNLLVFI